MASKAETRATILSLAKELDVTVPDVEQIDKLEPLEALLKELQDKKAALSPQVGTSIAAVPTAAATPAVGAPPPAPTLAKLPEKRKVVATTYVVAEGKSVTTLRDEIGALEHIWPSDFGGGQKDLDHWVANGFVTKTDHFEQ
jgi:hypothetical protein